MAELKITWGTKTALAASGLATLASGTYTVSSAYSVATNRPVDLAVEVSVATTNTPAGNTQVVVFAQASFDGGTTWQSGPISGASTADELALTWVGALPVRSTGTTHTKSFTIAQAYGGNPPPMVRFVFKNDLAVALTSASVSTIEAYATVI